MQTSSSGASSPPLSPTASTSCHPMAASSKQEGRVQLMWAGDLHTRSGKQVPPLLRPSPSVPRCTRRAPRGRTRSLVAVTASGQKSPGAREQPWRMCSLGRPCGSTPTCRSRCIWQSNSPQVSIFLLPNTSRPPPPSPPPWRVPPGGECPGAPHQVPSA